MAKLASIQAAPKTLAEKGRVLQEIVERKRIDVAKRMAERPLTEFRDGLESSERSLFDAMRKPGPRYVLECKRGSPSQGLIREDFDAAFIARTYDVVGDAISVLTDEPYFGGSFEILKQVRANTSLPVLCKDFVVDAYQLFEARLHGADAILLMMSVLEDSVVRECLTLAKEIGMDCLVEVHDEAELERALSLDSKIIGVNNRNLKTLDIDLAVTEALAPGVSGDRIVISESGVKTHDDIVRLGPLVDGFLVGTSLMKQPDLGLAVRGLIFGRAKICGLTTPKQAVHAYEKGASFGGVIFASKSPRRVSESQAKTIAAASPLKFVGVFVGEEPEAIARVVRFVGLAAVQLHGGESDETIRELKSLLPQDVEIWRVVSMDPSGAMPNEQARTSQARGVANRVLFDTKVGDKVGGTGVTFDWSVLEGHPLLQNSILSGGLNPGSVRSALEVGTWALDVNSGVEDAPGIKSPSAVETLFNKMRGSSRAHEED